MKVAILCGGRGIRLNEVTTHIPKPLVYIGNKPMLWHIMKIYNHYGFNDFVLCLGYKGELIKDYFGKEKEFNIEFVDTGLETNTGGRIKKIQKCIDGDFLATYGDGLADINLESLVKFHESKGKIATMTCVQPLSQYGIIEVDNEFNVTKFKEKPKMNVWINGGFFVFTRKIFDYLEENSVLEKEPFEILAKEKQIAAYTHGGFWASLDNLKDHDNLNNIFNEGGAPWKIWEG